MSTQQIFDLHPLGWENDPEEERYKISVLDCLVSTSYVNWALFFRLDDEQRGEVADILRRGLERTISQSRHVCGTIQSDIGGGHSFVKRRDSTVRFVVQYDAPGDNSRSFDNLEEKHFTSVALGDLKTWSADPNMLWGRGSAGHPDNKPAAVAFKANFIKGGLVFNMHFHHYANDAMGWTGFTHQLAENCYAIYRNTAFPAWDPGCNDLSRFIRPELPETAKIDGPSRRPRHPAHTPNSMYLFHLPKSKAAELKRLAAPEDGSWISTYDAFSAMIWRTLTRLRAPVYNAKPCSRLFWAEAIDMRRRLQSRKTPLRIQQNVLFKAMSDAVPITQPTVAQVIKEWPLWRVASYIHQLSKCVTEENLDETIDFISTVRDKGAMNVPINTKPPMSIQHTDHRRADVASADFGFAKPVLYRCPMDVVVEGLIIIYPPRSTDPDSDEGPEFTIAYENHLVQALLKDAEWNKYFEYRGVDAVHVAAAADPRPTAAAAGSKRVLMRHDAPMGTSLHVCV